MGLANWLKSTAPLMHQRCLRHLGPMTRKTEVRRSISGFPQTHAPHEWRQRFHYALRSERYRSSAVLRTWRCGKAPIPKYPEFRTNPLDWFWDQFWRLLDHLTRAPLRYSLATEGLGPVGRPKPANGWDLFLDSSGRRLPTSFVFRCADDFWWGNLAPATRTR